ncbi:MAG: hypothetical protein IJY75_00650 [Bacteroidaceae bacterium]|nr:hypothetical protein [Bacteroidaceae bacterium]
MKKIKPIVLKDATKLTNSEMKQIRGGYEPERSSTCSMLCPVEYGGSSITVNCSNSDNYCDSRSDLFGLACFNKTFHTIDLQDDNKDCERPVEG